jgi:predicted HNH restriction endonuclease
VATLTLNSETLMMSPWKWQTFEHLMILSKELDDEDSEEGKLKTRFHKVRERDPKKVKKKKDDFLKKHGKLYCEVCKFDFKREYGSRGDGFIECHHTKFYLTTMNPQKQKYRI